MASHLTKIKRRKLHEFQSFLLHPKSGNVRDTIYENMILDVIFSIKIFLIAGSNNHAIEEVLPATIRDNKTENIIFFKYFFV